MVVESQGLAHRQFAGTGIGALGVEARVYLGPGFSQGFHEFAYTRWQVDSWLSVGGRLTGRQRQRRWLPADPAKLRLNWFPGA